jgi:chromosome segregation ATPase
MTNDEIEAKIKEYKKSIKNIELQVAKDEQRLVTQEEEKQKILKQILELNPGFDVNNLETELKRIEEELERELNDFEQDLKRVQKQIAENG